MASRSTVRSRNWCKQWRRIRRTIPASIRQARAFSPFRTTPPCRMRSPHLGTLDGLATVDAAIRHCFLSLAEGGEAEPSADATAPASQRRYARCAGPAPYRTAEKRVKGSIRDARLTTAGILVRVEELAPVADRTQRAGNEQSFPRPGSPTSSHVSQIFRHRVCTNCCPGNGSFCAKPTSPPISRSPDLHPTRSYSSPSPPARVNQAAFVVCVREDRVRQ